MKKNPTLYPIRQKQLYHIEKDLHTVLSRMHGCTFTDEEMKGIKPLIDSINHYATFTVEHHKRIKKKKLIEEIEKL